MGTSENHRQYRKRLAAALGNRFLRRALDRFRRMCGGLRRIQKVNEWYHRNTVWVIVLHGAGLALLAWIVAEVIS